MMKHTERNEEGCDRKNKKRRRRRRQINYFDSEITKD
jgi:hypothetical protein